MADEVDSKSTMGNHVGVQVPSRAENIKAVELRSMAFIIFLFILILFRYTDIIYIGM